MSHSRVIDPEVEAVLIELLRQGSRQAFDKLYQLYVRRLMAYCRQFTKNREDAEEIVQDTFVQLWRHREEIRQSERLAPFLFTIAKRRIINAYRSLASTAIYEDYIEHLDALGSEEAERGLSYADFLSQLEQGLQELSPTQARVIRLSRLEEMNNKEIAQMLLLSVHTVKNQLSLGLKALRGKMILKGWPLLILLWGLRDF